MFEVILVVLAYLLGSISTAIVVGKAFFNIDVREHGSGNAGATNTFRTLGKKAGVVVLLGDVFKGVLATKLILFHSGYNLETTPLAYVNFQVVLGMAAVLGHVFPIWANFKGGKGIATLFGMIAAVQPIAALCLASVFLLVFLTTKYVSLSSILAAVTFPLILFFVFHEQALIYRGFAIAAACAVLVTHYKNIQRLLAGSESKMSLFKNRQQK
ncbi:MAG: glycerol-3-phosphate 1-O-acyltransferase PlsY [Bacteroidota bacterium]|jgi:glycerol-3-phosphate acyltransferase PlsY